MTSLCDEPEPPVGGWGAPPVDEISLRPLSRAQWAVITDVALANASFTDQTRTLLVAPLALALTGWTGAVPFPADLAARAAVVASWPLQDILAARERLVALSLASEGDS